MGGDNFKAHFLGESKMNMQTNKLIERDVSETVHRVVVILNKQHHGHNWTLKEINRAILRLTPTKTIDADNPEHIESILGVMNGHRIIARSIERLKKN